jgi:hypothetical protein
LTQTVLTSGKDPDIEGWIALAYPTVRFFGGFFRCRFGGAGVAALAAWVSSGKASAFGSGDE